MSYSNRYKSTLGFRYDTEVKHPFLGLRSRIVGKAEGVVEHTIAASDRLDLLALHYYNDDRKWWRILDANPEILCGIDISDPKLVGTVIIIPASDETRIGS